MSSDSTLVSKSLVATMYGVERYPICSYPPRPLDKGLSAESKPTSMS
jgi:hypothetical protein